MQPIQETDTDQFIDELIDFTGRCLRRDPARMKRFLEEAMRTVPQAVPEDVKARLEKELDDELASRPTPKGTKTHKTNGGNANGQARTRRG